MSKTPNYDAKVKAILDAAKPGERTCSITGRQWQLTERELEILRQYNVPPSTVDPEVRKDILNGFNTGLAIFWKKHMRTGEPIIAAIPPDSPIPVVTEEEWMTEDYSHDQEININKSVIDQLWGLVTAIPTKPTRNVDCQDSIVGGSVGARNSYIGGAALKTNRCYYLYALLEGEDCIDISNSERCQRCYNVNAGFDLADCMFAFFCRDSLNCNFIFDCWGCENCFGATNKRHKKYLWFNEQLTEEEWKKRRAEVDLSDRSQVEKYKARFYELWKSEGIWPSEFSWGNTDSYGDQVFDCVRCPDAYWETKSTDCYQSRFGVNKGESAFTSGEGWTENCYQSTGGVYSQNDRFTVSCFKCNGLEYCHNCQDCEYCFACVGLKRKKFCIYNKQYEEDEYWELVDELKCKMVDDGEYGEFFPAKFSQSGFQNSVGQLFYGYSDQELKSYGALKFDHKLGQVLAPKPEEADVVSINNIPDSPGAADDLVGKHIHDPELDRNFTIYPAELEMYKSKKWPLPRHHFVTRLINLTRHTNTPRKFKTDCAECEQSITAYKNLTFEERKILCPDCYLNYIEQYG